MSEIPDALELIRRRLNQALQGAEPRPEDWVILSSIVGRNGGSSEVAKDKIIMFLANIERAKESTPNPSLAATGASSTAIPPSLYIDLYVLFYANFYDDEYRRGLSMISKTISFFQQNPSFTRDNLPGLDPAVERLTVELTNLDLVTLSHLMGMTGARLLPSAYYKLQGLAFQAGSRDAMSEQP